MVHIDPNFCRLILVVAEAKAGQKSGSDKRALILVAGGLIFVATSNANSITSFFAKKKFLLLLEKLAPDIYSYPATFTIDTEGFTALTFSHIS